MATIKKNSKAKVQHSAENDLQKAIKALADGARLNTKTFGSKVEYSIEYPEGGVFFITKRLFNQLSKTS